MQNASNFGCSDAEKSLNDLFVWSCFFFYINKYRWCCVSLTVFIKDYFKKESYNTHSADNVWSTQSKAERVIQCVCVDRLKATFWETESKIAHDFGYFMENSRPREKKVVKIRSQCIKFSVSTSFFALRKIQFCICMRKRAELLNK